jgi:N-acetylglutamate synthase-like GNAT family acetyltransferase
MTAAKPELTFEPEKFAPQFLVFVIEKNGQYWGFYSLIPSSESSIELRDLFVDPAHMGCGVGTRLWHHAVATARSLGHRKVTLTADPNAERWYANRGAITVQSVESSVQAGRWLPKMEYRIADAAIVTG